MLKLNNFKIKQTMTYVFKLVATANWKRVYARRLAAVYRSYCIHNIS